MKLHFTASFYCMIYCDTCSPTSYDFETLMNISSALGSLFLSGCLKKSPDRTSRMETTAGSYKVKLASKHWLRCYVYPADWIGGLIQPRCDGLKGPDVSHSPFFGQVLVCPFDFCLTRTPADTQDFVWVVFRGCFHQLHTQNKQNKSEETWTCPRMSAGPPNRHFCHCPRRTLTSVS